MFNIKFSLLVLLQDTVNNSSFILIFSTFMWKFPISILISKFNWNSFTPHNLSIVDSFSNLKWNFYHRFMLNHLRSLLILTELAILQPLVMELKIPCHYNFKLRYIPPVLAVHFWLIVLKDMLFGKLIQSGIIWHNCEKTQ
jgi:hypothetical protein